MKRPKGIYVVLAKSHDGFEAHYPEDMLTAAFSFFAQIYKMDSTVKLVWRFDNGDIDLSGLAMDKLAAA